MGGLLKRVYLLVVWFLVVASGIAAASLPHLAVYLEGRKLLATEPNPPMDLVEALDAFNSGDLEKALSIFTEMEDKAVGFAGRAYVIGDLQFQESYDTREFRELREAYSEALKANSGNQALRAFGDVVNDFARIRMSRETRQFADAVVAFGPLNNPFYYKARLYVARCIYWDGAEGGDRQMMNTAREMMAELKKLWPENSILKQYTGEKVPWGEELNADTESAPAWAAYLREAYARQMKVLERWFTIRQSPDGQLGGGWGDDVELLRNWVQIAAISTAADSVTAGIQRLVDGIWEAELKEGGGFSMDCGDVEHSAEPSADTLPVMLFLKYGDPLYMERNMRSCKTIKEVFMGIDRKGYPRFKSSWYGAGKVNMSPSCGGDSGYNARTMRHFLWLGWWGNTEAKDWFVRWADGWRVATLASFGTKLRGLPPPDLYYPSGEMVPTEFADLWDNSWHAYGVPGMGGMIHDAVLAAYFLDGDHKFLEPFKALAIGGSKGPLHRGDLRQGSLEWSENVLAHMIDSYKCALYKWFTGERVYDEYALRYADPAQIYRVDYDLEKFIRSFQGTAESLRYNLEFMTTEVLSTDRAGLPGALSVFGAYTGAIQNLRDAAVPTFAVTYDAPHTDFAALVVEATEQRLRVWIYCFKDEETTLGLKLWRLRPGWYRLNQGEILPGEFDYQRRYRWVDDKLVKIMHRADTVFVQIPPRTAWVVDLALSTPLSVPQTAPDLAVNPRDLVWTDAGLVVTVHNLGSADAGSFSLALQVRDGNAWKTIACRQISGLRAPADFVPSTLDVNLGVHARRAYRVVLDPADSVYEICESNNTAEIKVQPKPVIPDKLEENLDKSAASGSSTG